jgi:hypothetical protein
LAATLLNEGDKFAFLAMENMRCEARNGDITAELSDGTGVLTSPPFDSQHFKRWAEWLGSLRMDRLHKANIALFRCRPSSSPGALDREHAELDGYLTRVFYLLRLGVILEYSGADLLLGSFLGGEARIRQVSEVPAFRPTRGSTPESVTLDSLEKAVQRVGGLVHMESRSPKYRRVIRGLNTLMEGLRCEHGEDRIHQFVRSLEALILPHIGKTKAQFAHRCQAFVRAGADAEQVLREAFDIRSDTEHMNDWDGSLHSYPTHDRENVALQRTRQMERLACFAYCKVLDDTSLAHNFESEAAQRNFWVSMDDAARRRSVGRQLNLDSIPIVRHYDNWGRPAPNPGVATD